MSGHGNNIPLSSHLRSDIRINKLASRRSKQALCSFFYVFRPKCLSNLKSQSPLNQFPPPSPQMVKRSKRRLNIDRFDCHLRSFALRSTVCSFAVNLIKYRACLPACLPVLPYIDFTSRIRHLERLAKYASPCRGPRG